MLVLHLKNLFLLLFMFQTFFLFLLSFYILLSLNLLNSLGLLQVSPLFILLISLELSFGILKHVHDDADFQVADGQDFFVLSYEYFF